MISGQHDRWERLTIADVNGIATRLRHSPAAIGALTFRAEMGSARLF
jgi:hypothetical protein